MTSEHISWETCPVCGGQVAIGWRAPGEGPAGTDQVAVEYDCVNGCSLSQVQLAALAHGAWLPTP